jgi:hypothetical protein
LISSEIACQNMIVSFTNGSKYDSEIFRWTPQQLKDKRIALATLLENGLSAAKGSFQFLYQS